MGIFRVDNLSKAFGEETLFSNVSFELNRGERVGLIGANGAGKSTLMRCMLGLETYDSGRAVLPAGETIGYVEQDTALGGGTLYEELSAAWRDVIQWRRDMDEKEKAIAAESDEARLQALMSEYARMMERFERGGGYEYENRIRRVAAGLGFSADDLKRSIDSFSGGQKTRISLAKALAREPDFLFLDEPTNHLDITMVEWLEEFLAGYGGGVLIISHDRYFLDRVANRIFELDNKELIQYKGNYSVYLKQKAERLEAQARAYEKQQAWIAKTEAFVDRYRAGVKSKQARGRQAMLDRVQRINAPRQEQSFSIEFEALSDTAERVLELDKVTAAYGSKLIFEKLSLLIRRNEGVALVGPNGAGKTTLLKLITGDLSPKSGAVKIGSRVKIGYFSQEHENLRPANRVLDEIMYEFGLGEERARSLLGAFLFSGDDVYKLIGSLSGGEKARLALLKLMMTGANFLILDEPTNHLDIPAKEAVEEAILNFPGAFLAVSHDRYFLDRVAERVIELSHGSLAEYIGNYSYYREKKVTAAAQTISPVPSSQPAVKREAVPSKTGDHPKSIKSAKSVNPKLVEKLEQDITGLELMIKALERRLDDPDSHTDPAASQALADEYNSAKEELQGKYDKWLELTSEE